MKIEINVAKDFSDLPYGRTDVESTTNATKFKEEILIPAINKNPEKLIIDFNGVLGLGGSFVDEAFYDLYKSTRKTKEELNNLIEIKSDSKHILEKVKNSLN